jgi:uncharacterized protein (DUF302 family)
MVISSRGWFMPASDSLVNAEGLTTIPSRFRPKKTMDRLETEIRAHGMNIFARIDHAEGAREAGLELRPTAVIIFGNARGGTPLMQSAQTTGIDLPLKALVWQDAANKTWISYNEPSWIAQRHGLTNSDAVVAKMTALLSALTTKATKDQ